MHHNAMEFYFCAVLHTFMACYLLVGIFSLFLVFTVLILKQRLVFIWLFVYCLPTYFSCLDVLICTIARFCGYYLFCAATGPTGSWEQLQDCAALGWCRCSSGLVSRFFTPSIWPRLVVGSPTLLPSCVFIFCADSKMYLYTYRGLICICVSEK